MANLNSCTHPAHDETSSVGFLEAGKRAGPPTIRTGRLLFNENAVNTRECNRVKGATQVAMLLKLHLRAWVQQA
jgi:hypothetical protein